MTDQVENLTVEILKGLRDDLVRGFEGVSERLDQTNARLERVEYETRLNGSRLEHLVDFAGERYRDHEARIRALEAKPR